MNANVKFLAALTLSTVIAPFAGATSFDHSVQDFYASGPVAVVQGERAHACAQNLDESPISILIALLVASNGSVLAEKQVILQPGAGVCIDSATPSAQQSLNLVSVLVPNGRLNANNTIVQDRPGGGCIAASMQVQVFAQDNISGQTLLYVPMLQHQPGRSNEN